MQAVILAGGLGTRMRPFTDTAPKCLLPVHGKPFIDYQLQLLCGGGVKRVLLCIGYLGEMVREYVETALDRNMVIEYSWDSPEADGTAGALKLAESILEERFFIIWGDSYVQVNHQDMMRSHCRSLPQVKVTMAVFRNNNAYDSSNVMIQGTRVTRYDRSSPQQLLDIDAGISVFEKSVLAEIPSHKKLDLAPFFATWASEGSLGAYRVSERFYEVGSRRGLADFEKYLDRAR